MSKKKPTSPIPLTGVVTITTDGRTTLAMKASHRGEDIEVSTGLSHCRPGDVYSEYEGARIALARLYGLDPFPKVANGSGEKGHWAKATRENCQKGARVRVVAAENTDGAYKNGDQGVIQDTYNSGSSLRHIIFDGHKTVACPGCWPRELEVWVPDAPEEAKPREDKPQEKGRWEKATKENCKEGSRVRVIRAVHSFGAYKDGDTGVVNSRHSFDMVNVKFDGKSKVTQPACFLDELEVWVPDAPEEAKPQEAPIPEAPKPFTPSFQVGDIVRLWENDNTFATVCRGKVGKVRRVSKISDGEAACYELAVKLDSGILAPQFCTEWPNDPAPLELLFRDPQKDGEKA